MGKAFVTKKVTDRLSKPVSNSRVQKKTDKIKEKHSKWVEKISKKTEEKIERSKQPLESLNLLKRSLEETCGELVDTAQAKSKSAPVKEALKHVSTKRGRKNTRQKEMEQFKLVMGHQVYRSNPIGVLQEHLTNTVKLQQKEAQQL